MGLTSKFCFSTYKGISACFLQRHAFSFAPSSGNRLSCLRDFRSVIKVKGDDISTFLQGLISNDVQQLAGNSGQRILYSCMFSAQGRFLHDLFLHRVPGDDGSLFLDVDRESLPRILKALKMYKLRSKVDLLNTSDSHAVWVSLGPGPPPGDWGWSPDPRLPGIGHRAVLPAEAVPEGSAAATPAEYARLRMQLGVPEGDAETPSGEALPLEFNLDRLNAISYTKGCYVGQELTARTHFQGVIRKRLMPVRLSGAGRVQPGDRVEVQGEKRAAGKVTAVEGEHGLALLRLEAARAAMEGRASLLCGGLGVEPSVPAWWPAEWMAPEEAGGG
mmetsp:Transcript_22774/g.54518  ORF Transcript_22774/g.54518 Transcript_22774/m.54518 type:complete len:331 (-) Transcript_22774:729-1721(-)